MSSSRGFRAGVRPVQAGATDCRAIDPFREPGLDGAKLSAHFFERCFGTLALVATLGVAVSSCANEPEEAEWFCSESSEGCRCELTSSPFAGHGASSRLEQCSFFGCCFARSHQDEELQASCECIPGATALSCGLIASAVRAAPVEQCPPGAPLSAPPGPACALEGEKCAGEELRERDRTGCCEGLVCAPDVEGTQRCRNGTEREQELYLSCLEVVEVSEERLELLTPALRTSVGTFELERVPEVEVEFGPGQCLLALRVSVGGVSAPGRDAECHLEIRVSEAEGGFEVGLSVEFEGCEGYTGERGAGSASRSRSAPVSFIEEAVSCESREVVEAACRVGTYDFLLDGAIGSDLGTVTFEDQLLRFSGSFCGAVREACRAP